MSLQLDLFLEWAESRESKFNKLGYDLEISRNNHEMGQSAYIALWGEDNISQITIWENSQCDIRIINAENGDDLSYMYLECINVDFTELDNLVAKYIDERFGWENENK